jgi:low affinity Fe/Cu permease
MIDGFFSDCSRRIATWVGTGLAFGLALASVLIWAGFGPATGYSDDWMLAINTGTTIVTFLMVFLIQHSQNHDTLALQVKLDELIRATRDADNVLIDIETLSPRDIEILHEKYRRLAARARELGLPGASSEPAGAGRRARIAA